MKVEKYSAELVHEEDGTIVIYKRTLVVLNVSKRPTHTLSLYTYERKDKDRKRSDTVEHHTDTLILVKIDGDDCVP